MGRVISVSSCRLSKHLPPVWRSRVNERIYHRRGPPTRSPRGWHPAPRIRYRATNSRINPQRIACLLHWLPSVCRSGRTDASQTIVYDW